jgi:hypothetical protein
VKTVAQALGAFERNAHLTVSGVHDVRIAGKRGVAFQLAPKNAPMNFGACGPTPCVPVFPVQGGQIVLEPGSAGSEVLVQVGRHVLSISTTAHAGDSAGLAAANAVLRTLAFGVR